MTKPIMSGRPSGLSLHKPTLAGAKKTATKNDDAGVKWKQRKIKIARIAEKTIKAKKSNGLKRIKHIRDKLIKKYKKQESQPAVPSVTLKDIRATGFSEPLLWQTGLNKIEADKLFPTDYNSQVVIPCLSELMSLLYQVRPELPEIYNTLVMIDTNSQAIDAFVVKNSKSIGEEKSWLPAYELCSTLVFAGNRFRASISNARVGEWSQDKVDHFQKTAKDIADNCFDKVLDAMVNAAKTKSTLRKTVEAENTYQAIKNSAEQLKNTARCNIGGHSTGERALKEQLEQFAGHVDDFLKQ